MPTKVFISTDLGHYHHYVDGSGNKTGEIFGHNPYGRNEFAEYINPDGTYTHVMGASLKFNNATTSNPLTSRITVKMWKNDGPNGLPGTVLATKDVLISQIVSDVNNGLQTQVLFNSPVAASSPYYIGFEDYIVSGDNVGLFSTYAGAPSVNTAWFSSNSVWTNTENFWGAGWKLSMGAFALVGNIPVPNFTATPVSGGPGTVVSFTNTSINGNGFVWTFPGGTPSSSFSLNPSVTYSATGSYNVKLKAYGSCYAVDSVTKISYINIGAPQLTATVTPVSCNGGNNGAINLTASGTGNTYLWSNGATTEDISGLTAGTYSVTVTSGGSPATLSVTVTQPVKLNATSSSTNVSCNGGNTGAVNLTVTGGTTPYLFSWSNSKTTQNISGLTAGTYSVIVTDGKGCTTTQSVTITQPTILATSLSTTNATCGNSNGTIALNVSGGSTPYTYNWSNGSTTQNLSGLGAGAYAVTVTDNKGCTKTDNATIIQPGTLTVSITSVTNVSCNGGNTGAIDITPSGGSTPYTYNWSGGAITQDVSGLTAGTYTIRVTDASSCSYNTSINVTQPAAMTVSVLNQTNVSCNGGNNGAISINVSGGTTPYAYNWSNGATTKDAVNLSAAIYTVTVTSAGGCTATTTVTIIQPPVFTTSVKTITPVSCNGGNNGSVEMNASGGVAPYSYNWNNGATTQNITGLYTGTYNLTATDKNGCNSVSSAVVGQPLVLSATIANKINVSCFGGNNGSINLGISGGTAPYTYNWNNGKTTQNISGLTANPYAVTVTDSKSCTVYQSTTITQPDSIIVTVVSQTNASCNGGNDGSVNISVTGGTTPYSYNWSNGSIAEDPSGLSANTYTVTVTDAGGCTKTKTITITQPSVISVTQNTITNVSCNGGNNGAIDINVSGGTAPYTYNWNNGAITQDISGLNAGTYSVVVTGVGGCSSVFSKTIAQPSAISIVVAGVTNATCGSNNGAVDITVSGGTGAYTYNWNSGATTQDISGLTAGNYNVTVKDANNCAATKTATVTQPGSLTAAITSITNVSCNGGSSGAINITPSGGTPPYTFNWSSGATTEDISSLTSGTYTVSVTDGSCTYVASAIVSQPAALVASVNGQTNASCNGGNNGSIDLSVTGGNSPYTYAWNNGSTVQDPTGLISGTYSVLVTSAGGCTSTASSITINEPSVISFTSVITNASCNGRNNGVANITVSGGVSPYAYNWSNGATTEDLSNVSAGTYVVTVHDANGCVKNSTQVITQPTALSVATANITDANCNTNLNGAVDINVSGGTVPYTFQWSNGTTTTAQQQLQLTLFTPRQFLL